jgi:hypothetical protein
VYLPRIQSEKQVQLNDAQMDELLIQHAIDPMLLRTDNYQAFIDARRLKLSQLVAEAMGKPVNTHTSAYDGIDDDTDAS